ncbi:MAG TPA: hypothetical protein VNW92_28400 [Polyangiaceae bacterium]|jgi:hypothetical protein|nr:hypothetical protein [Polyangiaceae bacterium]
MRTRTVWLGLVVALCSCGKAFDASSGAAGTGGEAGTSSGASGGNGGSLAHAGGAGEPAVAGASGSGGVIGLGGVPGIGGVAGLGAGGLGIGGLIDAGETPPIPTDGLALWLRADRGVVLTNGLVQQWLDQSGQGMDAIQTASNLRPKFVANGLNQLPTLDFDGNDDLLKLPPGFSDFSKGLTWFAVVNATDAACSSVVEMSNGTEIQDLEIGIYQKIWQYEVFNDDVTGGMANSQALVFGVLHHPTEAVELRLNGMQIGMSSFTLPENVLRQQNFVGGTLYAGCNTFKGQISEILMYSRAVTDKELLTIEGYLQSHWSIAF